MEPADVALLILRVAFGVGLAAHGYNKVFGGGGLAGTARWFGSLGMRWPRWQARLAAATEIGAGLGFAAGLLTPLTAGAIAATMLVALWVSHRKNGFFIFNKGEGWEYTAAIAVTAWTVAAIGPGDLSVDHALDLTDTWNASNWTGAVIAAVLGIGGALAQLAISYRPGQTFS
jgi:putative oxidoreductase